MADLILDTQAVPNTPGAGRVIIYPHSALKMLATRDDSGKHQIPGGFRNYNTADVVANAADTYLTGSGLTIPANMLMQVGTRFRWVIGMTKTGAGIVAPVWRLRVGTAGTTADTARCTFTSAAAQTGVIDTGWVEIEAIVRAVGAAAGVIAGILTLTHNLAATGFANIATLALQSTSAAFDSTVAGTIIGISVDPGAAGVWTHQVVTAECDL